VKGRDGTTKEGQGWVAPKIGSRPTFSSFVLLALFCG
jgi:hypothetical protein